MYVEGHLGSNLSSSGGLYVGLKQKPSMDFCWSGHGWGRPSAPLKEFDPSQWSRGGPQWHRLVGRWCLCGWHLGFIFEKMHEDLGRMEGAYWVYREHVLYHPKPTFDEVFLLLHFFFFNCPRLVATLL